MGMLTFLLAMMLAGTRQFTPLPLDETGINIETVCQDSLGNIWLGGIDGLRRYDGNRYTRFKSGLPSDAFAPDSHIYSIVCDENGRIWVAHINGVSQFDGSTQTFRNYPAPAGSVSYLLPISGQRYLSGSEKRLWIFDKETGRFTREGLPEALLTEVVTAVYKYGNTVYAGTADGRILMTDDRLSEVRAIRADLGNCQINCLLQDSPSRLWVGTEGKGLWGVSLTDGTTRTAIRAGIIKSLCTDNDGALWIGSKNGLYILQNDLLSVCHYSYDTPGSITHDSICDIFRDGQGTMWLGTYFGGACYYTPYSYQFTNIVSRPGAGNLTGNVISDIVEDNDGSLWIGSNSGGLSHLLKDGSFERIPGESDNPADVKCIFISPQTGHIYIGADRSEILTLDRKTRTLKPLGPGGPQSSYGCYAIVDNRHGGFYASGSDGLYEYDEKSGHFSRIYTAEDVTNIKSMMLDTGGILWVGKKFGVTAFRTGTGNVMELPEILSTIQYVEAFHEDAHGTIWLGSNNGLYAYDPASGDVSSYGEKDGLPDRVVHGIEEDASGILWVSTDNGLWCFRPSSGENWTFTTADGLLDNRFTPFAHCHTQSGKMYFGSLHGIVSFDPLSVSMHRETVVPVISGIKVGGLRRGIPESGLILKPKERDITLQFSSPDYISGKNGRFYYKLEGADKDWIEAGTDREAVYHGLKPGSYTFLLRYRNSSGTYSEATPCRIRVKAHWYETVAARMTGIILLILAVFAVIAWLLSRKEEEHKVEMEKVRSDLLRDFSLEFVGIGANKTPDKESSVAQVFEKSDENFMRQAMKVVRENLDNPDFSIDDFAASMFMSRSNLNLRVRALFGVSPLEFIKTVRFNEACRLLTEKNHSITQIAYMVGFTTPSYFAAAFRHFMGCTPSEYVKRKE
jgi:ligand-binding sensor domain-containing protein/AraC-like DNA-binding protein